jgi:hypothetical protein
MTNPKKNTSSQTAVSQRKAVAHARISVTVQNEKDSARSVQLASIRR